MVGICNNHCIQEYQGGLEEEEEEVFQPRMEWITEAPKDDACEFSSTPKKTFNALIQINSFQKNLHTALQIVPVYVLPAAELSQVLI